MSHASVLVAISPEEINLHGSVESAVDWNMLPFDENGEWYRDGSRWDWYVIGGWYTGKLCGADIVKRGDLNENAIIQFKTELAKKTWAEWSAELHKNEVTRSLIYHFDPDETEDSLVAKLTSQMITAYAFLRNRCWHEGERLGLFGGTAKTECELKAEENGTVAVGKCLHRDKESGASIVSWNDPQFYDKFWKRFILKLDPSITLVNVDYHV